MKYTKLFNNHDEYVAYTAYTFTSGDVVTVESGNVSDTFTFE